MVKLDIRLFYLDPTINRRRYSDASKDDLRSSMRARLSVEKISTMLVQHHPKSEKEQYRIIAGQNRWEVLIEMGNELSSFHYEVTIVDGDDNSMKVLAFRNNEQDDIKVNNDIMEFVSIVRDLGGKKYLKNPHLNDGRDWCRQLEEFGYTSMKEKRTRTQFYNSTIKMLEIYQDQGAVNAYFKIKKDYGIERSLLHKSALMESAGILSKYESAHALNAFLQSKVLKDVKDKRCVKGEIAFKRKADVVETVVPVTDGRKEVLIDNTDKSQVQVTSSEKAGQKAIKATEDMRAVEGDKSAAETMDQSEAEAIDGETMDQSEAEAIDGEHRILRRGDRVRKRPTESPMDINVTAKRQKMSAKEIKAKLQKLRAQKLSNIKVVMEKTRLEFLEQTGDDETPMFCIPHTTHSYAVQLDGERLSNVNKQLLSDGCAIGSADWSEVSKETIALIQLVVLYHRSTTFIFQDFQKGKPSGRKTRMQLNIMKWILHPRLFDNLEDLNVEDRHILSEVVAIVRSVDSAKEANRVCNLAMNHVYAAYLCMLDGLKKLRPQADAVCTANLILSLAGCEVQAVHRDVPFNEHQTHSLNALCGFDHKTSLIVWKKSHALPDSTSGSDGIDPERMTVSSPSDIIYFHQALVHAGDSTATAHVRLHVYYDVVCEYTLRVKDSTVSAKDFRFIRSYKCPTSHPAEAEGAETHASSDVEDDDNGESRSCDLSQRDDHHLEVTYNRKYIFGDGNCLFRSISFATYGDESHHHTLRKETCEYMDANPRIGLLLLGENRAKELQMMKISGTWAGTAEVYALEEILDRYIYISIQPEENRGGTAIFSRIAGCSDNNLFTREECIYLIYYQKKHHYDVALPADNRYALHRRDTTRLKTARENST